MNEPRTLKHIRAAIHSEPWAIMPPALDLIAGVAEIHVSGNEPALSPTKKQWLFGKPGFLAAQMDGSDDQPEFEPYVVVQGVALLPLQGPLFPKANLMTMFCGATSYEEFTSWLSECLVRSDVNAIAIVCDSPGGYARGMAETANAVFAARQYKPIIGVVESSLCASAAYGICSQCDELYCSPSSMIGSIGVVSRMDNTDRAERNSGNDPVTVASSELKAFSTPESLSQYQSLIERVTQLFDQFKELVARGRGNKLDISKVDKAQVFLGKQACALGLCDGMKSLADVIKENRVV